jgi:hypothetical protein
MTVKSLQVQTEGLSKHPQAELLPDPARESAVNDLPETSVDRWLQLQQTIGNQAVQRLMARDGTPTDPKPLSIQREDEDPWKFKPLPPELSYDPAGPFSGTLSPGGIDLGLGQYHLSGGGSPVDGSWNASMYYGSPLLPFPGDVTRDVNAGMAGLGSGSIGPALNMASTLGSLGTSPTMPFGAGVTASSTSEDPFKLMFGVQGSF